MAIDVGPSGTISADVVGRGRMSTTTTSELLELMGLRPAWMRDGLCREYPPELFFPGTGASFPNARRL